MILARMILALACAVLGIWWAIESVILFMTRRPVVARVIDRSYTDTQMLIDRARHPWDRIQNLNADAIQATVPDVLRVAYDVDGTEYRQDISSGHNRGERADSAPILWYDPRDPNRITTRGPGLSLSCSAIAFVAAAWVGGLI